MSTNCTCLNALGAEGEADGQLVSLESLDVDSEGNVYVADYGNDRIQKFENDGNFITKWGAPGEAVRQFDGPTGLGVDLNDNKYVIDTNNHRIQKFSDDGAFILDSVVREGAMGNL
ncbi:MAG: hypothetical protein ACRD8W_03850 [Nitrososphaeraceae archaeon]